MNFVYLHKNRESLKILNFALVKSISIISAECFEVENPKANFKCGVYCKVEFSGIDEIQGFCVIFENEEKEDYFKEAKEAVHNRIAKALWNGEESIDVVIIVGRLTF